MPLDVLEVVHSEKKGSERWEEIIEMKLFAHRCGEVLKGKSQVN